MPADGNRPQDVVQLGIRLVPRQVQRGAVGVALALAVLSVLGRLQEKSTELTRVLSVDAEQSLPTLWSALQLLAVAGLAALVARRAAVDRRWWGVVTSGLLYVALDDALSFHEFVMLPTRNLLDPDHSHDLLQFAWVVPGSAALLVAGLLGLGFVRRMDRRLRRDLLLAVGVFLSGAVGCELVGASVYELGDPSAAYVAVTGTEELLEMVGVALAGSALLRHLARTGDTSSAQGHVERERVQYPEQRHAPWPESSAASSSARSGAVSGDDRPATGP
jgi:hypothetical protein